MTEFTFNKQKYYELVGIADYTDQDISRFIHISIYRDKYSPKEVEEAVTILNKFTRYDNALFDARIKWLVENEKEITFSFIETYDDDVAIVDEANFCDASGVVWKIKDAHLHCKRFRKTLRSTLKKAGATNPALFELRYVII